MIDTEILSNNDFSISLIHVLVEFDLLLDQEVGHHLPLRERTLLSSFKYGDLVAHAHVLLEEYGERVAEDKLTFDPEEDPDANVVLRLTPTRQNGLA